MKDQNQQDGMICEKFNHLKQFTLPDFVLEAWNVPVYKSQKISVLEELTFQWVGDSKNNAKENTIVSQGIIENDRYQGENEVE